MSYCKAVRILTVSSVSVPAYFTSLLCAMKEKCAQKRTCKHSSKPADSKIPGETLPLWILQKWNVLTLFWAIANLACGKIKPLQIETNKNSHYCKKNSKTNPISPHATKKRKRKTGPGCSYLARIQYSLLAGFPNVLTSLLREKVARHFVGYTAKKEKAKQKTSKIMNTFVLPWIHFKNVTSRSLN